MAILVKKEHETRLIGEIETLKKKNKDLYNILCDVSTFCENKYNMDITVTHIFRTKEEQKEIYGNNDKKSPHELWLAFDLRSTTFNKEEINEIEHYINAKYNSKNYFKFTTKDHTVYKDGRSFGPHFHFQFTKNN